MKRPRVVGVAVASALAALGVMFLATRPPTPAVAVAGEQRDAPLPRLAGEPPPAADDDHAYAPGSPAAVSERFLRAFWRQHYVDAEALATGEVLARCRRDEHQAAEQPPEYAEILRRVRVFREASRYRLERVTVSELPPLSDGAARRLVIGEAHATGPSPDDARMVENRLGQRLELTLVDGAWKVAGYTSIVHAAAPADGGAGR